MANRGRLFSKLQFFLLLLTSESLIVGSVPMEPMCSKFSYDEQLLEKMVRMEFFVADVKKDVDKSASNVMEMLTDIKGNNSEISSILSKQQVKIDNLERQADLLNDTMAKKSAVSETLKNVQNMKLDVENIKRDMKESTSDLNDLQAVTGEKLKKCEDRFAALSRNISDLKKQFIEVSSKTGKTQAVAFNVMDAVSYTGKSAIKFSNIILNEGNAYDKDTGIFTAPTDGLYQFIAHICCKQGKDIEYFITADDTKILMGEFRLPDSADDTKCTSFGTFALVRKGGKVSVGGMEFSYLDRVSDSDLSSFSGALIQII